MYDTVADKQRRYKNQLWLPAKLIRTRTAHPSASEISSVSCWLPFRPKKKTVDAQTHQLSILTSFTSFRIYLSVLIKSCRHSADVSAELKLIWSGIVRHRFSQSSDFIKNENEPVCSRQTVRSVGHLADSHFSLLGKSIWSTVHWLSVLNWYVLKMEINIDGYKYAAGQYQLAFHNQLSRCQVLLKSLSQSIVKCRKGYIAPIWNQLVHGQWGNSVTPL